MNLRVKRSKVKVIQIYPGPALLQCSNSKSFQYRDFIQEWRMWKEDTYRFEGQKVKVQGHTDISWLHFDVM